MSFPVPNEYDMPDVKYNNGDVITLPPSLSGDGTGVNLSQLEKDLILTLFSKAAYAEDDASTAYDTLENLWTSPQKEVESITAVYTQSGTVYITDSIDSLKADLVVTANYVGGTSEPLPASAYTLSGTLAEGTSTITVSYAGLTDTFNVTVTSSRPSNPYVTDNMTLWLDGIFNTATGHNASATTWTNLIDNTTLTNVGITVGSDGMIFDGTRGHGFIGDTPSIPATIEVVLDVTDPSTTQVVIGAFGNDNNGNVNVKSSQLLQRKGSSTGGGHALSTGLHTHTFVNGSAEYVDGVAVSTTTMTISMGATGAFVIGNALGTDGKLVISSTSYPLTGTIKCIRFYSDALTAQEVASNFAVDASRFGIS